MRSVSARLFVLCFLMVTIGLTCGPVPVPVRLAKPAHPSTCPDDRSIAENKKLACEFIRRFHEGGLVIVLRHMDKKKIDPPKGKCEENWQHLNDNGDKQAKRIRNAIADP